jgi:hypothetical protein
MSKPKGRPTWFKLFLSQKAMLDAMPSEAVGDALKAALQYFDDGSSPALSPLAQVAFASLKEHADEAAADFSATSAKNRKNRLHGLKNREIERTATSGNDLLPEIPTVTEAEAEAEFNNKKKRTPQTMTEAQQDAFFYG